MLEDVKKLFIGMTSASGWELNLLRIAAERGTTRYAACNITLDPPGTLQVFANSLLKHYIEGTKALLERYTACADYDGSSEASIIYRLSTASELIAEQYPLLLDALAHPTKEAKPLEFNATAYVITASIEDADGQITPVKLFSMQSPFTQLRHRFLHDSSTFKEIPGKVLYLRESIDVLIYGSVIFFLDMRGENLFSMERSYKKKCSMIIEEMKGMDICSDYEAFASVAVSGINPRRFISFNRPRLIALSNPETRPEKASLFQLQVDNNGKINTSDKENSEKLIKVLCRKGMYDPFEEVPVEVPTSRKW